MNQIFYNVLSFWGAVIFIGLPLLMVLTSFLINLLDKKQFRLNTLLIFRSLIIPCLMVNLFCLKILKLAENDLAVKITATILFVFVAWAILSLVDFLLFGKKNLFKQKEFLPQLARDVINVGIIILVSIFVLSNIWDIKLGHLLTAFGVGSFVLGLALQEPLGNLFTGISLLLAQPFHHGDWVQIGDEPGQVVDINWRSVKILNRFNELVIIPNNLLGKEKIKNLSRPSSIHAELITIGFSYDDHPVKVKECLLKVASDTTGILESPAPQALTLSYDDFYINYGLKFYIQDFADQNHLKDQFMTQIYDLAKEYNLTIPYPVTEVRILGDSSNENKPSNDLELK